MHAPCGQGRHTAKKKAIVKPFVCRMYQIGTHDSPSIQGKGKPKEHDKTVRKAKEAGVLPINNFITISDTSQLPSVWRLSKPYR